MDFSVYIWNLSKKYLNYQIFLSEIVSESKVIVYYYFELLKILASRVNISSENVFL